MLTLPAIKKGWEAGIQETGSGRFGPRGSTPLYRLYRYVPPQRVWLWRRFGLRTDIDFAHFGLESGMVYKGTTIVYGCVRRFNFK